MVQNIFLQMDYKIIWYLHQSINILAFFSGTDNIYSCTSKGMSEESIKNPSTSGNSFAPKRNTDYQLSKVKFNGNCLKQDRVSILHKSVVNWFTTYKLDTWSRDLNTYLTIGNCLFGAVTLRMLVQLNMDIAAMDWIWCMLTNLMVRL